jgi:ligand-binding SRPBCC domain-containing protein
MRTALQVLLVLSGVAAIVISLLHIVFGPAAIPGSIPVNATMDSEDRFYATLFTAYGVALLWCVRGIEQRSLFVYFLAGVFFVGGLARLVSIAVVGLPHPFFIAMTILELGLPVVVVLMQLRVSRAAQASPEANDVTTGPFSFTMSSHLAGSAERVWTHASDFQELNREFWPLLRMTYPAGKARMTPESFPLGTVAFRSWMLLFGVLPVEYDDITLVELVPGQHFSEVSRMLAIREWRHRRGVTTEGAGCLLQDDIAFTPRWRLMGPFQVWLFRLVFKKRHRALRRLFGDATRAGAAAGGTEPPGA